MAEDADWSGAVNISSAGNRGTKGNDHSATTVFGSNGAAVAPKMSVIHLV